jgi:hypothetical protein
MRMVEAWFIPKTIASISQIKKMKAYRASSGVAGAELTYNRSDIENCEASEREKYGARGFVSV